MKGFKKYRLLLTVPAFALATVLLIGAGKSDFDLGKSMDVLFNIFRDVNIMYVDDTDPEKMLEAGANAMLGQLDPYTEYISPSDMEDFRQNITGKYGGVGSVIRKTDEGIAQIAEVYRGFPADKAGLHIGDLILSVDGKETRNLDLDDVSAAMKGLPGSKVKMRIRDIHTGSEQEISLTREQIAISSVSSYGYIKEGVGYLSLENFTDGCTDQVRKAIVGLRKEGTLSGLIIDLRNNGGGILEEAVEIVSLFVPKGTEVVSMRGKMRGADENFRTTSEPLDTQLPLAILVNRASASSSEIVAGALQDLDRAVIIGQRTFGKGLVQTTRAVGYGSFIKVTTAKYYIPSGRCIQALDYSHRNEDGSVGMIPDSLISEFTTRNGRKVYDGGGIMPDVVMEPDYMNKFAAILNAYGHIDEFANRYYQTHPQDPGKDFTVSEQMYREFTQFMATRDVEYVSATENTLKRLRQYAEQEKYITDIDEELSAIEEKIKADKTRDLEVAKADIKELIENAILLRYRYLSGMILEMSRKDDTVNQAAQVLTAPETYNRILTSRDTQRNVPASKNS